MTYDFGNTGLGLRRGTNIHIFVYKILLKLYACACVCVHCQFFSIPPKSTTMYLVPTSVMTNPGLDP